MLWVHKGCVDTALRVGLAVGLGDVKVVPNIGDCRILWAVLAMGLGKAEGQRGGRSRDKGPVLAVGWG